MSTRMGETEGQSGEAAASTTDLERAVNSLISVLRAAGAAAGLQGADLEHAVARMLAFIRRRLEGDYEVDDFGLDVDFTEHVMMPMLRPLFHQWFRTEVSGIENLPERDGALIVANHSGGVALDSLMTQVAVRERHPHQRYLRMLGADLVFSTPLVGPVARRTGSTLATSHDAELLLERGELVGVWPEGFKGVGKNFRDRYRLQRFGRGGFVSAALRTQSPIIPCAIVGAEESYPVLGNAAPLARVLGLPYFPLTPTFPWLGPAGLLPLPSKWHIAFGPAIETSDYDASDAEDPAVLFELTDRVRETIQHTLFELLGQRRSVFY